MALLALAIAGCGGDDIAADEVPGPPPSLTVTSDGELGAAGESTDDAASGTEDADADPGATDDPADADPGTTDPGTATPPDDTSGGAAAPEATAAPEEETVTEEEPAPGSPPEQFEDFCEQNAGAC